MFLPLIPNAGALEAGLVQALIPSTTVHPVLMPSATFGFFKFRPLPPGTDDLEETSFHGATAHQGTDPGESCNGGSRETKAATPPRLCTRALQRTHQLFTEAF